jgi:hypothetical protein
MSLDISTRQSIAHVFDMLVDSLNQSSTSMRNATNVLKSTYQLQTPPPSFYKARHVLFSEMWLYGVHVYPETALVVKAVEDITEVLCEVAMSLEVSDVIPNVILDCRATLNTTRDLQIKYNKVLESLEGLRSDERGATAMETESSQQLEMSVDSFSEIVPVGSVPPNVLCLVRTWTSVGWTAASSWLSSWLVHERSSDATPLIVRNAMEAFIASVQLLYQLLQSIEAFMERIENVVTEEFIDVRDSKEWLNRGNVIITACSLWLSLQTHQERALFSTGDKVDDKYEKEWVQKLDKNVISRKVIVL